MIYLSRQFSPALTVCKVKAAIQNEPTDLGRSVILRPLFIRLDAVLGLCGQLTYAYAPVRMIGDLRTYLSKSH